MEEKKSQKGGRKEHEQAWIVALVCNPSIWRVEAGGPRTQGSLGYTIACFKGGGGEEKKPELPVPLFLALLATSKCL